MTAPGGRVFFRHAIGNLGHRRAECRNRHRPFAARNRAALDEATRTSSCHRCGYSGVALLFVPPPGQKSAARLVQSSEAAFQRAMKRSKPTCLNCACELRGPVASTQSAAPSVRVNAPAHVEAALACSDDLNTRIQSKDTDRIDKPDTRIHPLATIVGELFSEVASSSSDGLSPPQVQESQSRSAQ